MLSTAMLLIVLILLLLYLGSRKPRGYPPGPDWWPVLGSVLEVARIRQETGYLFQTCTELYRRYGRVVGLKIGVDRIVILNDYDSIRAMLTDEDCSGRPNAPFYKARTWGERLGLIVVDGDFWVEQRRFILGHLREFGFGRHSMAMIVEDEAQKLVEHFKKLMTKDWSARAQSLKLATNNNCYNDGKIYKLQSTAKIEGMGQENQPPKILNAADMYVKAEEYAEVRKMAQPSEVVTSMHDAFGVTVLNSLWRMMAGKRYNPDDKELTYLQRILTQLLREVDMIGATFGHFPLLRFVAPELSGYKSFVETHRRVWKFLQEELNNHKNTFKPNEPRDLMDVYLDALQSENRGESFTESQLLAACVDLFIAGSETTSKVLGFCFLYLILYPNVQRKAQEEIDRLVGSRAITLADRPRLTYINAIVLESMRMFMGRTLNVPHRAMRDTVIAGYRIPKDTMLIANLNRVLMDESWGDPEVFRPERFIDSSGNISTPPTFFPFGIGKHRCMGEILARSNIFVIVATLLQTFTFTPVPGESKPSARDFVDGVTAGPKPYRALVSVRTKFYA